MFKLSFAPTRGSAKKKKKNPTDLYIKLSVDMFLILVPKSRT